VTEGKAAHTGARKARTWQSGLNNGERANTFNPATPLPKQNHGNTTSMRGSETRLTRRSHTPEDVGSNPTPASNIKLKPWEQGTYDRQGVSRGENLACPECHSQRLYRDGLRYLTDGTSIQRYLCRDCSFRFSHSLTASSKAMLNAPFLTPKQRSTSARNLCSTSSERDMMIFPKSTTQIDIYSDTFINNSPHSNGCQVSVAPKKVMSLATVETRTQENPTREGTTLNADVKGILVRYMAYLENEGYAKDHDYDHAYIRLIRLLIKRGANLLDPENVKSTIAKQPWKDGVKRMAVYAYDALTKVLKIEWAAPEYKQEERLPFIPEEKELDALISGSRSRRMTAFLQTLKETFADPGEAIKLRWVDLDSQNNTITINHPVRGHNPRQLKVSNKLVALLNALPKTSERIFPTNYTNLDGCFRQLKRKVAHNLQNPRILSISFTTFRHWGATMTYHYTRKILLVKELLGHKRIENTMKYTHLVKFQDNDFEVETATNVDQAKVLLKVGFDYIAEKDGIMLFRRPKRFGSLGVTSDS